MLPIPRIDVQTASRDKLIAHIDTLEDVLTSLLPKDDESSWVRMRLGLTMTQGRIMSALLKGRCLSRHQLRAISHMKGDEYETKAIDVHLNAMRKRLQKFGIEIKNDWSAGFYVDEVSLKRARDLLEGGQ